MKRTCLLVILVAASLGLGQAPPSPRKPLDQIQVLTLLACGVPSERLAALVNEQGISFEPNEDYLTTLKNVGAEDVLLAAVRAAKHTKAEALSAEGAAKRQQAQEHLVRGAELRQKKLYAEAEQEYRAALELEPDNPDLHFALGYALDSQKKWDLAAAEYRTAIRLKPDDAAPHNNLGNALLKNDFDGAIAEFHTALRLQPDDATAHAGLSVVLEMKGDLRAAIEESRTAHRLDPKDSFITQQYERLLREVNQ